MPNIQRPTIKQHYVPQVYLRGFSQDKKRIYRYDVVHENQIAQPVAISSVCYKKEMYELSDGKGKNIAPNYIENVLGEFEAQFNSYMTKLKETAYKKSFNKIKFLSDSQENAFWIAYIAIQILRTPEMLSVSNNFLGKFFKNKLPPEKIRAVSLAQCLPFFSEITPESDTVYTTIINSLCDLSFVVGIDKRDRIFTSDNPVFCQGSSLDNIEKVIFPLSSDLVLFLVGKNYCDTFQQILFFEINNIDVEEINWSISCVAKSCILSKYLLEEAEIKQIKQAQQDKKNSEEN